MKKGTRKVKEVLAKVKEKDGRYSPLFQLVRRDELKGKALIAKVDKAIKEYTNSL